MYDSGRAAAFAARHGERALDPARVVAGAAATVLFVTWSRVPARPPGTARPRAPYT
ncbi:hypothetical protein [Streptomyces puniciscabiei]|uniref:hypothetical protein n=1 Tax=Streptomyces puniciscabiei TaxID=164348 RepID=UPI000A7A8F0D|nr:hypothetical protein [Streptomyces puniciscabiei]